MVRSDGGGAEGGKMGGATCDVDDGRGDQGVPSLDPPVDVSAWAQSSRTGLIPAAVHLQVLFFHWAAWGRRGDTR